MERFEHEIVNRAHVLRPHGEFRDLGELSDAIVGCLTAETRCVVVNWAGITRISSTGLGGVIRGEQRIRKLGGCYRNCGLTEERKADVTRIKVIGFEWNFFATEVEAVTSCPDIDRSDESPRSGSRP